MADVSPPDSQEGSWEERAHLAAPNLAAKLRSPTRGAPNVTAVTGGARPPFLGAALLTARQNLTTASSVASYTLRASSDSAAFASVSFVVRRALRAPSASAVFLALRASRRSFTNSTSLPSVLLRQSAMSNAHSAASAPPRLCPVVVMLPTCAPVAPHGQRHMQLCPGQQPLADELS